MPVRLNRHVTPKMSLPQLEEHVETSVRRAANLDSPTKLRPVQQATVARDLRETEAALTPAFWDPRSHTVLGSVIACDAKALRIISPEVPYIIVSISDLPPDGQPYYVPRRRNCKGVCRLAMQGLDLVTGDPRFLRLYRYGGLTAAQAALNQRHLAEIASFVGRHIQRDISCLVIQCPDGQRSVSIALGLCDGLGLGLDRLTWQRSTLVTPAPTEAPNKHAHQLTERWFSGLRDSPVWSKCHEAPRVRSHLDQKTDTDTRHFRGRTGVRSTGAPRGPRANNAE